jgi:hypothetical protein
MGGRSTSAAFVHVRTHQHVERAREQLVLKGRAVRRRFNTLVFLLMTVTLVSTAVAQTTWVVDDNGTGDFVHIQDAVDAAQSGDVIFVLDGAYASFTISAKSLVVVGEPGGDVRAAAVVAVQGLGVTQKVELDHLRIGLTYASGGASSLSLGSNLGSVRIVDCELYGFPGSCSYYYEGAALGCQVSRDVGILRSTLIGGECEYYAPGLDAFQCNVIITDSTVVGGRGRSGVCLATQGGPGARLRNTSTLRSFGTVFEGGQGGYSTCNGFCSMCNQYWPDGEGIEVLSGSFGSWKTSTFNGQSGPETGPFRRTNIAEFCFGTFEECPCGNNGKARAGCDTSYASGGVKLRTTGNPRVSADTLTLIAMGLHPNANPTGLFFQGTTSVGDGAGLPFNDGLLCAGGTIRRLKGKLSAAGTVSFGSANPNDAAVSVRGAIPPEGGTYTYQLWFRHQAPQFCTSERFHMSNGVEITWQP